MHLSTTAVFVLGSLFAAAVIFCLFFLFVILVSQREDKQRQKDNALIGSMMAELDQIAREVEPLTPTAESKKLLQDIRQTILDLYKVSIQVNPVVRKQGVSDHQTGMQVFRDQAAELVGQETVGD